MEMTILNGDEVSCNHDENGFIGKLAFPFEYLMSPKDNAVLTISPSIMLHEVRFGGGNLQVHWPL